MISATPRQVAVALVVLSDGLHAQPSFLVVSSRKHKLPELKWVLPKGGIEEGETAPEAAQREAWEEAGLIQGKAMHLAHLVSLPDGKAHAESPSKDSADPSFIPSTEYSFELFTVGSEDVLASEEEWLEEGERQRKWVQGWDELKKTIAWGRREETMKRAIVEARGRLG